MSSKAPASISSTFPPPPSSAGVPKTVSFTESKRTKCSKCLLIKDIAQDLFKQKMRHGLQFIKGSQMYNQAAAKKLTEMLNNLHLTKK